MTEVSRHSLLLHPHPLTLIRIYTSSISGSQPWLDIKIIWGALKTSSACIPSPDSDVILLSWNIVWILRG